MLCAESFRKPNNDIVIGAAFSGRFDQLGPCEDVLMTSALINVVMFHEHGRRQHEVGNLGRLSHELLVDTNEQILARESLFDEGLVGCNRY